MLTQRLRNIAALRSMTICGRHETTEETLRPISTSASVWVELDPCTRACCCTVELILLKIMNFIEYSVISSQHTNSSNSDARFIAHTKHYISYRSEI